MATQLSEPEATVDFWIQTSNPTCLCDYDANDETLNEAIQTVFPLHTECAILVWHHLCIALSYKYDISVMIDDAIALLSTILDNDIGTYRVNWPSSEFRATWVVKWDVETLSVDADWALVVGVPVAALNESGMVQLAKQAFVAEWKQLLGRVLDALRQSGYLPGRLLGMRALEELHDRIEAVGVLYR